MKKYLIPFLFFPLLALFGQELFVIDTRGITVEEFEEKYKLNIEVEGLEASLHKMVDAELFYQAALNEKIHEQKGVALTLNAAKAKMVRERILSLPEVQEYLGERFERSIRDVQVQVLFFLFNNETEFDAQFKKAKEVRKKWLNSDFSVAEFLASNTNPNIQGNSDYYVRGMQEDFALENLAFTTPEGQVSEPAVVNNALVVLKNLGTKTYSGDYRIRAISFDKDKQQLAQSVYDSLQNNLKFTTALNRYSNIAVEKQSGGYMPFRGANIPAEIWNQVKDLKVQEYTKPVLINDRWYVFQLYSKEKCNENDLGCKEKFRSDFLKSPLALTIDNVIYPTHSKDAVPVEVDSLRMFTTFQKLYSGREITDSAVIATIGKKTFTTKELADLAKGSNLKELDKNQAEQFLQEKVRYFLRKSVYDEYTDNLELYDPEFAKSWEVTNKSTLIAAYMQRASQVSLKEDSAALRDYYNKNQTLFWDEERMEGSFFICYTPAAAKEVAARLKKKEEPEEIVRVFKDQKTKNGNPIVALFRGEFKEDDSRFYGNVPYKKGVYSFAKNDKNYVVAVHELIDPSPVKFEWISSKVMEYYKDYVLDVKLEDLRQTISHGFKRDVLRNLKVKYSENP